MRKDSARIDIIGVSGKIWTVSGAGMGKQGIELATNPDDIHNEAPFKTIWQQSAFQEGATYLGRSTDPIDLVLGFNVVPEFHQDWQSIESEFFSDLNARPELGQYVKIRHTSPSGTRILKVIKLERVTTKSKHDPRILQYSQMVVTLRAPWPFWEGETVTVSSVASQFNPTATLTLTNPTDRPIWIQWTVTAPGKWAIPDYDLSSLNAVDRNRRIVTPYLSRGQDLTIDTNPLRETYVSADGSNVAGLFNGVDFMYPLPPHTGPVTYTATYTGAEPEAGIQARLVHNWMRAWGGEK